MKNEEESNQPMDKTKLPYGRLTFDGNFCDIAKCREERWGKYCPDGACSQRKVWERLKEYEDTTMSPTDVLEYKKVEDELIASGMTFMEKASSKKRLIDANALIKEANADGAYGYVDAKQIADAPTVDAVEVVRCFECKHLMFSDCYGECGKGHMGIVSPYDFCSYGERKEGAI